MYQLDVKNVFLYPPQGDGQAKKLFGIEIAHNKLDIVLNKSMLWIYYRRLDYLAASQFVFLWILMLIYGMRYPYFEDVSHYRRLVRNLIYLTVTWPDIAYIIRLVNQFMHKSRQIRWKAVLRILTCIKRFSGKCLLYKKYGHLWVQAFSNSNYGGDKRDVKSTFDYYTYVGGNLVTWRSKKQKVVSF